MVAFHPFSMVRKSVLTMWSPAVQARRQVPDARLPELFVLLHGMLFTNIQLDDFKRVLERFQEKLEIGGKIGGLFFIYRRSFIAVRPVLKRVAPWVAPVVENLAAKDMPSDAPFGRPSRRLQCSMPRHQIVQIGYFKGSVVETRPFRRLHNE